MFVTLVVILGIGVIAGLVAAAAVDHNREG